MHLAHKLQVHSDSGAPPLPLSRSLILLALLLLCSSHAVQAQWREPILLRHQAWPELSGLVCPQAPEQVFWAINDGGNPAALHALDAGGRARGKVLLRGAGNRDWEALSRTRLGTQSRLVVADTGDNFSRRDHVRLYVLAEPSVRQTEAQVLERIDFRFADGPRDVEALAVDAAQHRYLLVDKGRRPAGLYALAMAGDGLARRIADIPHTWPEAVAPVQPLHAYFRGAVTDMALRTDGRELALLTLTHLLRYSREDGEDWPQALARSPAFVRLPAGRQFEALCYDADAVIWIVDEARDGESRLYRYEP